MPKVLLAIIAAGVVVLIAVLVVDSPDWRPGPQKAALGVPPLEQMGRKKLLPAEFPLE
jgi:hypothetical protein